ncbi:MAG: KamA family radical SAM protein [Planctomycetota bacterium]
MQHQDDWRWQLRNRITTIEELEQYIELTPKERAGIEAASERFTWAIPPYYAGLMDPSDPEDPIRRQAVPSREELQDDLGVPDPLEEGKHSPTDLIIRVYPDRIAFCVGNRCAMYCRHCLRKETMVGRSDINLADEKINEGIRWIENNEEIRDVLLTGGDPLLLPDERVESIVSRIHSIPHVEVIRIGSRTPCTLPQRITPELCQMLQQYHPLYLNTHFNHPREITPEAQKACTRLAEAGIPLGNQSVLLKGVNDSVEIMKELCQELMRIRVRPYYIYQCQVLSGTQHFRTPVECGREIVHKLQGFTSGLAVPKFIVDTPYGKIPLSPRYGLGREGDEFVLRSWSGKIWREPNPVDREPVGPCMDVDPDSRSALCGQCATCRVQS